MNCASGGAPSKPALLIAEFQSYILRIEELVNRLYQNLQKLRTKALIYQAIKTGLQNLLNRRGSTIMKEDHDPVLEAKAAHLISSPQLLHVCWILDEWHQALLGQLRLHNFFATGSDTCTYQDALCQVADLVDVPWYQIHQSLSDRPYDQNYYRHDSRQSHVAPQHRRASLPGRTQLHQASSYPPPSHLLPPRAASVPPGYQPKMMSPRTSSVPNVPNNMSIPSHFSFNGGTTPQGVGLPQGVGQPDRRNVMVSPVMRKSNHSLLDEEDGNENNILRSSSNHSTQHEHHQQQTGNTIRAISTTPVVGVAEQLGTKRASTPQNLPSKFHAAPPTDAKATTPKLAPPVLVKGPTVTSPVVRQGNPRLSSQLMAVPLVTSPLRLQVRGFVSSPARVNLSSPASMRQGIHSAAQSPAFRQGIHSAARSPAFRQGTHSAVQSPAFRQGIHSAVQSPATSITSPAVRQALRGDLATTPPGFYFTYNSGISDADSCETPSPQRTFFVPATPDGFSTVAAEQSHLLSNDERALDGDIAALFLRPNAFKSSTQGHDDVKNRVVSRKRPSSRNGVTCNANKPKKTKPNSSNEIVQAHENAAVDNEVSLASPVRNGDDKTGGAIFDLKGCNEDPRINIDIPQASPIEELAREINSPPTTAVQLDNEVAKKAKGVHSMQTVKKKEVTKAHEKRVLELWMCRMKNLLHAAACAKSDPNECPKQCAKNKELLCHIPSCDQVSCPQKHCYDTRCMISHFRSCSVVTCQRCSDLKKYLAGKPDHLPKITEISPKQHLLNLSRQRLLLIHHATSCKKVKCEYPLGIEKLPCAKAKLLVAHLKTCNKQDCDVKYCSDTKKAIAHYQRCKKKDCELCTYIRAELRPRMKIDASTGVDATTAPDQVSGNALRQSASLPMKKRRVHGPSKP